MRRASTYKVGVMAVGGGVSGDTVSLRSASVCGSGGANGELGERPASISKGEMSAIEE